MKKLNFLLLTIFCSLFICTSRAQQTGSFNATVNFMGQNRTLSCYVPTNYDSTVNYRLLIGLHGLGDNSINYRNVLINGRAWNNIFDSTIFIFPDGGSDVNKDFYAPAGDEEIIAECISYARQNYSLDTTDIILQGFSLGGRSALAYGLSHPSTFKGLLLTTPAMQGLLDVQDVSGAGLGYAYGNASQVPIYTTVGSTDVLYTGAIDALNNVLKKNDAKLEFVSVNGLGHSMPNSSVISPCIPFFENPAKADFDMDIFEIDMDERSCDPNVSADVYVRNLSNQTVTNLDIDYTVGGSTSTLNWTGNIGLYEHAVINVPFQSPAGQQSLNISVGNVNGSQVDPDQSNNQLVDDFEIVSSGKNLPINEGFEANEDGWLFEETGSLFAWDKDNTVSRDGQASLYAFNTILVFNTLNAVESFSSPVSDLSSVSKPTLAFDLAFNYHQYTPPYFTDTVNFSDTLEVLISTDCGQSFQSIYKKAGADLATVDAPILNPLNIPDCFLIPVDSNDWRRERIDLSAYASSTEAVIKFNYISGLGGSIYIDNIDMDDASVISVSEFDKSVDFKLYPNPATDIVRFDFPDAQDDYLEVYDLSGVMVHSQSLVERGQQEIDLSSLSRGYYLVKLFTSEGEGVQKLLIDK